MKFSLSRAIPFFAVFVATLSAQAQDLPPSLWSGPMRCSAARYNASGGLSRSYSVDIPHLYKMEYNSLTAYGSSEIDIGDGYTVPVTFTIMDAEKKYTMFFGTSSLRRKIENKTYVVATQKLVEVGLRPYILNLPHFDPLSFLKWYGESSRGDGTMSNTLAQTHVLELTGSTNLHEAYKKGLIPGKELSEVYVNCSEQRDDADKSN